MAAYEVTLELQGAQIRIPFDDVDELEGKLEGIQLERVADLIDDAMDRFPHPPGTSAALHSASSRRLE